MLLSLMVASILINILAKSNNYNINSPRDPNFDIRVRREVNELQNEVTNKINEDEVSKKDYEIIKNTHELTEHAVGNELNENIIESDKNIYLKNDDILGNLYAKHLTSKYDKKWKKSNLIESRDIAVNDKVNEVIRKKSSVGKFKALIKEVTDKTDKVRHKDIEVNDKVNEIIHKKSGVGRIKAFSNEVTDNTNEGRHKRSDKTAVEDKTSKEVNDRTEEVRSRNYFEAVLTDYRAVNDASHNNKLSRKRRDMSYNYNNIGDFGTKKRNQTNVNQNINVQTSCFMCVNLGCPSLFRKLGYNCVPEADVDY